jgi:hypothetical protein
MTPNYVFAVAVWATLCIPFAACGGSGSSSGFGGNGGNGSSGSGSSGSGTSSGSGSGGGASSGGLFGDDGGGASSGGALGDAACVTSNVGADAVPVMLVFMFDRSGSMADQSKWTSCSQGLDAFFSDPNSKGLLASLQFFAQAKECQAASYQTPLVPMQPLPSPSFTSAIAGVSPNGGTPTLPALQGAIAYAQQNQTINPNSKVAVVLVTDGDPNDCNSTVADVSAAAKAVASTVPTYVIGIGSVASLDAIAAAGGTGKAFVVSTTNPAQTATDLETALAAIKGSTLGCEYQVPTAPAGQSIDFTKVNVIYTPSGGSPETLSYNATCGGNGQGWYYDNPSAPTKIEICAASCTSIEADKGGKVSVALGCDTVVVAQ